jgi:hypothetical protein
MHASCNRVRSRRRNLKSPPPHMSCRSAAPSSYSTHCRSFHHVSQPLRLFCCCCSLMFRSS